MLRRVALRRTRPAPARRVRACAVGADLSACSDARSTDCSAMTLDIVFERYLLTLHAIVVAFGLIVYVGVARALPQRRDPSAAIAWVVALALLPVRRDPALPDVRQPEAADARRARAAAADRAGRRRRRRGGVALGAPPRPLDGPGAGRAVRARCTSTPTAPRRAAPCSTSSPARPARSTSAPSSSPATASATRSPRRCARRPSKASGFACCIDGIGAWLSGRLDVKALRRSGVEVVTFVPPFRSILRGRANLRNHRKMIVADAIAALVRRPQLRRRVLRRRSRARRRRLARPQLRPARRARRCVPPSSSRKTGTTRPGAAAALASCPRRTASCPPDASLAQLVPERPRAGRRHRAGAARVGLLHGAAAHPRRHAVLHSRRDAADGADARGAARRARSTSSCRAARTIASPTSPATGRCATSPPPARGSGSRRSCCTRRPSSSTSSSRSPARPTSTCAACSSTTS